MSDASELPVAGTAVILRDSARGPEVLLMRRPDRGSFASGWVFPGGKVEDADAIVHEDALVAERETARSAAVRETHEEIGLQLDTAVAFSRWHPPVQAPVRIRTWFFLATDPGGALSASVDEVVDVAWMTPADALAKHAAGEIVLYPPTWVTLHSLLGGASAADILAAARAYETEAPLYVTQILETPAGTVMTWQGDEEHENAGVLGARHRLDTTALPWRFERS